VVIYAYQHHVRLLSPEPEVVKQPQSTRVKEPTLLCNQVIRGRNIGFHAGILDKERFLRLAVYQTKSFDTPKSPIRRLGLASTSGRRTGSSDFKANFQEVPYTQWRVAPVHGSQIAVCGRWPIRLF